MYVKCPHCDTSFVLEPAVVMNFGGWARCGACMQPFNSEAAVLDELPVDDPADVLVRTSDYADDAGHFKAKNRNSFIVEPHSRSEIPEFLRVGEAATEDQAQIPLPLNDALLESQSDLGQPINIEFPSDDQGLPVVGSVHGLIDEVVIDEELQRSSSIERAVAVWPEEQVAHGVESTESSDAEEYSVSVRVEKRKYGGVRNISSSPFDRVMSDKAELQNPRLWLVAIIIFFVIAVAQLVNLNKLELSQTVFGRPMVNLWCQISGCSPGELVQIGKIELVHTTVSAHDTKAGVLVVDVHLVSRTALGQPLPGIQLTLTDRDGMPAARRIFTAQEYLPSTAKNELVPNVITEFKLEIADPPDKSVGFEVALVDQR
ncbi:MAG: zinc-ribbon and DUF3426 domain-containing protein [Arenicellaceae bacterium]|nr:zinc-ribbon and DUF3426 domain-containing protein [Arenicellaceae bacterium]